MSNYKIKDNFYGNDVYYIRLGLYVKLTKATPKKLLKYLYELGHPSIEYIPPKKKKKSDTIDEEDTSDLKIRYYNDDN